MGYCLQKPKNQKGKGSKVGFCQPWLRLVAQVMSWAAQATNCNENPSDEILKELELGVISPWSTL
jgi:hypothetical protein